MKTISKILLGFALVGMTAACGNDDASQGNRNEAGSSKKSTAESVPPTPSPTQKSETPARGPSVTGMATGIGNNPAGSARIYQEKAQNVTAAMQRQAEETEKYMTR